MRLETEDDLIRRDALDRRDLDLAALGQALRRRKMWVIGPALACLLGSAIGVNLVKPRFTAESKILLENQESFFTRPDRGERETAQLPDDEAVQSQVQLVTSRDIARDAIKVLDLQGNPEFDPLADGMGPITRLGVLLGLERDPLRATPEDRILTSYYEKLSVFPVVKSRVLSVQFTATDPDLAAKAANTISDLYINLQSSAKRDSARAAADSLASLIATLRVKAAAAETKAQEYRAQNGLLVGTNNNTVAAQGLTDISTQLAQARTAEADAQAKAKTLRDMIRANRINEVPDVANNDTIRKIYDQRMAIKGQIAQQAQTLLPGHPRMQELNAQLADIDTQLRVAGERTVRTLENEAHIAAARVDNLKSALDTQKLAAGTAGASSVDLNALEQTARVLKDQLDFNTQKYQEAVARENAVSTPADARIISRAVAPELPSFPKKIPMIAIFTLAGLLLSMGIIVARELLSGRALVRDLAPGSLPVQLGREETFAGDDVDHDLPLRPSLPGHGSMTAAPRGQGALGPDGMGRDLVALLDLMRDRRKEHGGVRVLLTGAEPETSVMRSSLRLARALAKSDRVILVDCGADGDGLAGVLAAEGDNGRLHDAAGLSDLLAGQTTFAEVIHRDTASRLHVVPAGTDTLTHAPEGFVMVVDALAETYDYVLLAIPTPMASHVSLQGAEHADLAALFVAPETARVEVDESRAALYAAGVPEVVAVSLIGQSAAEQARSAA